MTAKAEAVDPEKVKIVLQLWHDGIKRAAALGKTSVRDSELNRVRTPIPPEARAAALNQLKRDGFDVYPDTRGRLDGVPRDWIVSWAPPPLPPQGGSGTSPRRGS